MLGAKLVKSNFSSFTYNCDSDFHFVLSNRHFVWMIAKIFDLLPIWMNFLFRKTSMRFSLIYRFPYLSKLIFKNWFIEFISITNFASYHLCRYIVYTIISQCFFVKRKDFLFSNLVLCIFTGFSLFAFRESLIKVVVVCDGIWLNFKLCIIFSKVCALIV